MNIRIDLNLMYLSLVIIAFVFGVVLAIAAYKLLKLIKRIDMLVEANEENITKVIKTLPELTQNVNDSILSVKETVDSVGATVGVVEEGVTGLVVARKNSPSFFETISTVVDLVKSLISIFK